MTKSSTCPAVEAKMLPLKLYLVVFYQVSLVNLTRITCSDFRRPSVLLLGSPCCTISHFHTPCGNCNKCSSMIVFVKYSVSYTLFVNLISPGCFFPWLLLVVEKMTDNFWVFHSIPPKLGWSAWNLGLLRLL